jgi:hypothetical protein
MAWQKKQNREIALGAVRSEMRKNGFVPQRQSARTALAVLNEIALSDPGTRASWWYLNCSDNELTLFIRDWKKWCISQRGNDRTSIALSGSIVTVDLKPETLLAKISGRLP